MIDAVDSGGYGVLGLYAAQAPVVPEAPSAPPVTSSETGSARPAQAVQPAQAQGSGPLPAADPGADGSATAGRDFGDSGQGLARQAAVLTTLAGASGPAAGSAATGSPASTPTSSGRALRAYDRAGTATTAGGSARTGVMVATRA